MDWTVESSSCASQDADGALRHMVMVAACLSVASGIIECVLHRRYCLGTHSAAVLSLCFLSACAVSAWVPSPTQLRLHAPEVVLAAFVLCTARSTHMSLLSVVLACKLFLDVLRQLLNLSNRQSCISLGLLAKTACITAQPADSQNTSSSKRWYLPHPGKLDHCWDVGFADSKICVDHKTSECISSQNKPHATAVVNDSTVGRKTATAANASQTSSATELTQLLQHYYIDTRHSSSLDVSKNAVMIFNRFSELSVQDAELQQDCDYQSQTVTSTAGVKVRCEDDLHEKVRTVLLAHAAPTIARRLQTDPQALHTKGAACVYGCVQLLVWVRELAAAQQLEGGSAASPMDASLLRLVTRSLNKLQEPDLGRVHLTMPGHCWSLGEGPEPRAAPKLHCSLVSPVCLVAGERSLVSVTVQAEGGEAFGPLRVLLLDEAGGLVEEVEEPAWEQEADGAQTVRFKAPAMTAGFAQLLLLSRDAAVPSHMMQPLLCLTPEAAQQLQGMFQEVLLPFHLRMLQKRYTDGSLQDLLEAASRAAWQGIQALANDITFLIEGRERVAAAISGGGAGGSQAEAAAVEAEEDRQAVAEITPAAAPAPAAKEPLVATLLRVMEYLARHRQQHLFTMLTTRLFETPAAAPHAASEPQVVGLAAHAEHSGSDASTSAAPALEQASGDLKPAAASKPPPPQPLWHAALFGFRDRAMEAAYEAAQATGARWTDWFLLALQLPAIRSFIREVQEHGLRGPQLLIACLMHLMSIFLYSSCVVAHHMMASRGQALYKTRMAIITTSDVAIISCFGVLLKNGWPPFGPFGEALLQKPLVWDFTLACIRPFAVQAKPGTYMPLQVIMQLQVALMRWRHGTSTMLWCFAYDWIGVTAMSVLMAWALQLLARRARVRAAAKKLD